MYVVNMKICAQYAQGDYSFSTKSDVQKFLEGMNIAQLEMVNEITKYNKRSFRNAYFDFFN